MGALFLLTGNPWIAGMGVVCLAGALFCAYFFRDPARQVPQGDHLVLSPCDGTVMQVTEENGMKVVRMFLSVMNVHLQRAPLAGVVKSVEYRPGKCVPAMRPDAHIVNEQNVITIETDGGNYIVKQIAGILARRVVSWVKAGDRIDKGQKIGIIKFGSQVDLHLPSHARITVRPGDTVVAGETTLGEIQ
jgi:phosphatidylserine decarboxylase